VIQPIGITGVYYNITRQLLSVVFLAKYVSGVIEIQPEEINEAKFVKLDEKTIDEYITRPNMRSRTLDAMKSKSAVPYESWEVLPYILKGRKEGNL
jgi:8-oxo-dGTP diphosphatase